MSQLVLDSGIYIASVFPETLTSQAKSLLKHVQAEQTTLNAPSLLHYELVAVARKTVYQNRVTPVEGLLALNTLMSYPVNLHFDDLLLRRGYELATEYNHPRAYDAQYMALAERLDCEFWTLDERLFNALNNKGPAVRWVGNWQEA